MPVITSDLLRRLPKAELHCHLDGSVRPQTLLDLGRDAGVAMPESSADALRAYMRVDDARNLEDYLARFGVTLSVMQTAEAIERVACELGEDAARDGVRYLETRFSPVLNTRNGLDSAAAVEAAVRGLARAERDFGVVGRVIVCALRNLSPETSMDLARVAVLHRHGGVVGFDLAGGEQGFPAAAHAAAFAYAREHGMACTCHAGEGDGAGSVWQALHLCGAHRIGHGTRLIEDAQLTGYVTDRRIPVEICLTSNVQTRVASDYAAHPARTYYDRGVPIVFSTDNRLMSDTTLSDEYAHAARSLGFTFDELCDVARAGFESAFLPWEARKTLIQRMTDEIEALRRAG